MNYGNLNDNEGNSYKTIQIGSQTWMAENLRATKYSNGENIPYIADGNEWVNLNSGAYSNQDTDIVALKITGRLYNWYTTRDPRNICPDGWRVPNDNDWGLLLISLGMNENDSKKFNEYVGNEEGNALRETGTLHWVSENGATNSSGFTALPSGYRDGYDDGHFAPYDGSYNTYWEASDLPRGFMVQASTGQIIRVPYTYTSGFCVRCVKD